MTDLTTKVKNWLNNLTDDFVNKIKHVSINGIEWAGILALHAATVPSLLALMAGLTDRTPPLDVVLITWTSLGLWFVKSIMKRDFTSIAIIGFGFMGQAVLMALIFFK